MAASRATCVLSLLLLPLLLRGSARAADVCTDEELEGPYGFLLSGRTTISGSETPVVSLGRIVLDDEGTVNGSSSVHFTGKVTPGGNRAEMHQTDPGADARGVMAKTSDACQASSVRPQYAFTLSG